jgi:hypothetical protein
MVASGYLVKVSAIDPVLAVREHAAVVRYSVQGTLMGLIFFVLGLVIVISSAMGKSLRHSKSEGLRLRDPQTGKLNRRGWVFVLAVIAVSGGVHFAVEGYLRAHGYGDSNASPKATADDTERP